jgi:hypothetical protein
MAQQPITRPGTPYYEVSRSCRRIPWMNDQLAARWPSHHPFRRFLIIPNPPTRVLWQIDQKIHLAGNWARNMDTQFCLRNVSTLVGFFYMPYIYDMGPTALPPLQRKTCLRIFNVHKNPSSPPSGRDWIRDPSPELSTQPLDQWGRSSDDHQGLNLDCKEGCSRSPSWTLPNLPYVDMHCHAADVTVSQAFSCELLCAHHSDVSYCSIRH